MTPSATLRQAGLHFLAACGFAIAQPLFETLARNPQFFVARHSKPIDIVAFVAIVVIVPAALAWLLLALGSLLGERVERVVRILLLSVVFTALGLYLAKLATPLQSVWCIALAFLFGAAVSIIVSRFSLLGSYLSLAAIAPWLFAALFLLQPPVSRLVWADSLRLPTQKDRSLSTPIVMIVFDELPLVSLLDAERVIDSQRYPGFGTLAETSTWYRHATSVAELTGDAMAGLLTGTYPSQARMATAIDYPRNLFTVLGSAYDFSNTKELATSFCPEALCTSYKARGLRFQDRLLGLLADAGVVYLHLALPERLSSELPPINRAWSDFVAIERLKPRRGQAPRSGDELPYPLAKDHWLRNLRGPMPGWYLEFLEGLQPPGSTRPSMHFAHVMLPHIPWVFLPSGAQYGGGENKVPGLKADDSWEAGSSSSDQAYLQHLLQVGFTDALVADLLARLREVGLFDSALIVVTADHGASFRPGNRRRHLTEQNPDEILAVPLFIKLPHQRQGTLDDRAVELIDVLPTIIDSLGIDRSWKFDGHSLLGEESPERLVKLAFTQIGHEQRSFSTERLAKFENLERKLRLFGTGEQGPGLFRSGPHAELVGTIIDASIGALSGASTEVEIDQEEQLQHVDPNSAFVPAYISGRLRGADERAEPIDLAVSLNGVVAGTTRAKPSQGQELPQFSLVLDPSFFVPGTNRLEVYRIDAESNGELALTRIGNAKRSLYALERLADGSELITTEEREWAVAKELSIVGRVDTVDSRPELGRLQIGGWILDETGHFLPDAVLLFSNGRFLSSTRTSVHRQDIENAYSGRVFGDPGFTFEISVQRLGAVREQRLRVFALVDDSTAWELRYPRDWDRIIVHTDASLVVREPGPQFTQLKPEEALELVPSGSNRLAIEGAEGKAIQIVPGALRGHVAKVVEKSRSLTFLGWAIDQRNQKLADRVMIFVNGKLWHASPSWIERPDVTTFFDNERLLTSGFTYVFPRHLLEQPRPAEIRFFAASEEGVATELWYPDDYRWLPVE